MGLSDDYFHCYFLALLVVGAVPTNAVVSPYYAHSLPLVVAHVLYCSPLFFVCGGDLVGDVVGHMVVGMDSAAVGCTREAADCTREVMLRARYCQIHPYLVLVVGSMGPYCCNHMVVGMDSAAADCTREAADCTREAMLCPRYCLTLSFFFFAPGMVG